MPRLGDIEKLKDIVDSLGNEKEIRRQRGERVEEVAPPEQEISPSDLDTLLGAGGGEGAVGAGKPTEEIIADALGAVGAEDAQIDDISSALEETGVVEPSSEETMGLDVLPESFGEEAGQAAEAAIEPETPTDQAFNEFELPDFGGAADAETERPPLEETAEGPGELVEETVPFSGLTESPESEAPGSEQGEPTFDLSDFQISEPSPGAEGGADRLFEEAPAVPAVPVEEEIPVEAMEGLAEIMPEGRTEAPDEIPAGEQGGFDLSDLGEWGGAGIEPEGEAPAGPEAGEAGFGGVEEKLFDLPEDEGAPAASGEDVGAFPPPAGDEAGEGGAFAGFEMPDLSEIGGAPGEEPAPGAPPEAEEAGGARFEFDTGEFAMPETGEEPAPAIAEKFGEPTGEFGAPEELAGAEEELQFSQRDFENMKAALAILPLNLKIAVEDLVGEGGLRGPQLKRLLDALIAGESPKTIAAIVSGITGRKIVLPRSFEKRSGIAFEREKGSFGHFLRTKGARAALVVGAAAVVLAVLAWGAYLFVFRPLYALSLYDEGYDAIGQDHYEEARRKFDEASRVWDSKDQYYRFAEAYVASAAGNYRYADQMYRALLRRHPGDIKGMIDWARLETLQENYQHAESLLVDGVLKRDGFNFDGLAASADNYLAWSEEDASKLKDADYYYTALAERYRDRTAAHLKRIAYLLRGERIARAAGQPDADNTNLVIAYAGFLRNRGWDVVDPIVYAEMAGYLIDKNETDAVPELLDKARAADPAYARTWYEIARYERLAGDVEKERRALERAVELFRNPEPSPRRGFQLAAERRDSLERTAVFVLALNRLGEYYIGQDQPERAEDLLVEAQRLYEGSAAKLKASRFAADGEFGRVYYNLGNIAIGAGNDARALAFFTAAEENGFSSPDQTYKKGFIHYRRADYAAALGEFHRADLEKPDNEAVLFALATTEYRRFQYRIAEGYYLYLIGVLAKKKDALPAINVETNPAHRDLITNFYITYNNLGCTLFKESGGREGPVLTEAANYLRKASEFYDVMSRDPDTLARLEETTIAARVGKKEIVKGKGAESRYLKAPAPFYNLDVLFHGKADSVVLGEKIDVLVYDLLPRDLDHPELLSTRLTTQ